MIEVRVNDEIYEYATIDPLVGAPVIFTFVIMFLNNNPLDD